MLFRHITAHLNIKRLSIITCSRRLIFPQTKFPSYNEIIKTLLLRFTLILDFFFANLSIVFFITCCVLPNDFLNLTFSWNNLGWPKLKYHQKDNSISSGSPGSIAAEIAKARQHIKNSLECVSTCNKFTLKASLISFISFLFTSHGFFSSYTFIS